MCLCDPALLFIVASSPTLVPLFPSEKAFLAANVSIVHAVVPTIEEHTSACPQLTSLHTCVALPLLFPLPSYEPAMPPSNHLWIMNHPPASSRFALLSCLHHFHDTSATLLSTHSTTPATCTTTHFYNPFCIVNILLQLHLDSQCWPASIIISRHSLIDLHHGLDWWIPVNLFLASCNSVQQVWKFVD